jgi:hypothetical protein
VFVILLLFCIAGGFFRIDEWIADALMPESSTRQVEARFRIPIEHHRAFTVPTHINAKQYPAFSITRSIT